MKNGNLYQEVKSAKKDYKVARAKKYEIELEMQRDTGKRPAHYI